VSVDVILGELDFDVPLVFQIFVVHGHHLPLTGCSAS
jgi:hypothetical protein